MVPLPLAAIPRGNARRLPSRVGRFVALRAVALAAMGLGLTMAIPAVRAEAPSAAIAKGSAAGPVDLNTADEATLESLPGVGPALAKQIIAGRPFSSADELAKVKGIGPAKLAALRNQVTVGGAKAPSPGTMMPPSAPPNVNKPMMPAMPKAPQPPTSAAAPAPVAPRPMAATPMPGKPSMPMPAGAMQAGTMAGKAAKLPAGKVNVNTAPLEELEALPGIGPVKAKAIVAGRPYEKPEDVMKVPGVKQGIYGKIKDYITVQ